MLVASYLLGYDKNDAVKHLAVDNILPDQMQGADVRLFSRGASADGESKVTDLILLFPGAVAPQNIVCLPALPQNAVSHLLAGMPLQVVDFAHGRKLSVVYTHGQQRCA